VVGEGGEAPETVKRRAAPQTSAARPAGRGRARRAPCSPKRRNNTSSKTGEARR